MPAVDPYTLEDAERDIATLRGQADRLSEVLTKNDSTDPPNTPAAGLIHYSSAGQHKYASADGNGYNTGHLSLYTTSLTTVNSTSAFTLLSCPVSSGSTYRIDGIVRGTQGPATIAQFVRFAGPATSFGIIYTKDNAAASTINDGELSVAFPVDHTTPAWPNGTRFWFQFRGIITFSAAGTLSLQARSNSDVNTWTAEAGALMDVMPVS